MNLRQLLDDLARFPWLSTAQTLRERFREDRLGLTASSLTFTTTIALVPFFTVALALFTAFPLFDKLQANLQAWLVQSLVPDAISRQVLRYLTQFAGKASQLGVVGLGALVVSALALVFTIDRTLNGIWRVRRPRPLAQRVLIYWAAITLGPLLLAASLSTTSYVLSASRGLVRTLPGTVGFLINAAEFLLLALALSATRPASTSSACSRRWASRWPSGCWPGTWARCRPIRRSMAPSLPCRSCWSGSTTPPSYFLSARC